MTRFRLLAAPLAVLILALATAAQHAGKGHEIITPDDVRWVDGPPSLPPGSQMALLDGDPSKDGPFVMRAKMPDGYFIMPHTHPKDERITVLRGELYVGMGEKFDENAAKPMRAGSYGRMGAGVTHFAFAKGVTVIQVHGVGPWTIDYVNPADDPRKKK